MGPITTADDLIGSFESSSLDFKTTYDVTRKGTRCEIAKDVAALANAYGGNLVVGVREQGGRPVVLEGVGDVAKLLQEIATALQQYCVPRPPPPVEHRIVVTPAKAKEILSPGCSAPAGDITLLALYVQSDLRAPLGVRAVDEKSEQPLADLYRFPIRVDDRTQFLDPTELPMWMNSHERRIAFLLRQVDPKNPHVTVFQWGVTSGLLEALDGVDERLAVAYFSRGAHTRAAVPLSFIKAVWREPRTGAWTIFVEGMVFPQGNSIGFVPRLG
jgi:hypothetical protein